MTDSRGIQGCMIGTGEYTTGFVHSRASTSDKGAGVVALVLCHLRSVGKIADLHLCGSDGRKFPLLRAHMHSKIERAYGIDTAVRTYPADDVVNPLAYLEVSSECTSTQCQGHGFSIAR
jgi:D-galacturonate reductase